MSECDKLIKYLRDKVDSGELTFEEAIALNCVIYDCVRDMEEYKELINE